MKAIIVLVICVVASSWAMKAPSSLFVGAFDNSGSSRDTPIIVDIPRKSQAVLEPIILLPGLSGSALEGKLHHVKRPAPLCFADSTWFTLWYNELEFTPWAQPCFANSMTVNYDRSTGNYSTVEGVSVRPKDFGGVKGLDYLATKKQPYMGDMIDFLVKHGYEVGKSIRGAPYDWRWGADALLVNGDLQSLKELVEETYKANGGLKVHLVGHSMGASYAQLLLNKFVDQAWKDKHIGSLITCGGPTLGSFMATYVIVHGIKTNNSFGDMFSKLLDSYGSVNFMMPVEQHLGSDPTFITPKKTYTVADTETVLGLAGKKDMKNIYSRNRALYNSLGAPNVPVHCLYGFGIPTLTAAVYGSEDLTKEPIDFKMEDGDETVTTRSLQYCKEWASQQKYTVSMQGWFNLTHGPMMSDERVWQYILDVAAPKGML